MRVTNRFTKGSGVYRCRCCDHNTRDTGGDGAGVQLCDICYDLAGYDNLLQNNETLTKSDIGNILAWIGAIKKRNGSTYWDDMLAQITKICKERAEQEKQNG